jgi:predicted membrane-bound dolichyl-phosphate-mannose-protein mannosyltransferase
LDLIPIIILLALYLGLAYLTHATQGFYVYPFLDLQKNSSGIVGAYIVGILVAAIIIFLIVRYLIALRVWVTERKLRMTGKTSTRQKAAVADEYPLHSTIPK